MHVTVIRFPELWSAEIQNKRKQGSNKIQEMERQSENEKIKNSSLELFFSSEPVKYLSKAAALEPFW